MRSAVLVSAVIGGLCGMAAGLAGTRLFAEPPRGAGPPGTLRGDLDALEARILGDAVTDLRTRTVVIDRLAALEAATAGLSTAADRDETRRALASIAEDVRALHEAVAADLKAADARLSAAERRVRDLEDLVGSVPPAASGPLAEEEEAEWVSVARGAEDPLRRFSALVKLGRGRTDRAAECAIAALHDKDQRVVYQAVRNLAAYQERAAAREIAALLDHPAAILRHAAFLSLVAMGAPGAAYDPTAAAAQRKDAADAIKKWAAEQASE